MNILFIGGGRRNSLAKRFKKHGCKIFSYETDVNAPIALEGTIIKGERWSSPNVIKSICDAYYDNQCQLIIPLMDQATTILSNLNLNCPTASYDTNNTFLDKLRFESFSLSKKTGIINSYYPYDNIGKLVKKPRFGFNSRDINIINVSEEPEFSDSNYIIQKFIGGTEISVDCYMDKNNELVDFVPRTRDIVQGGEVSKSTTLSRGVDYKSIGQYIRALSRYIKMQGPYCIQFIKEKNTNNIFVIEVNARFGGGVILSIESGFDIPKLIIDEYILNEKLDYKSSWKSGLTMSRFSSEYFHG